jgi:hypothetical protein
MIMTLIVTSDRTLYDVSCVVGCYVRLSPRYLNFQFAMLNGLIERPIRMQPQSVFDTLGHFTGVTTGDIGTLAGTGYTVGTHLHGTD